MYDNLAFKDFQRYDLDLFQCLVKKLFDLKNSHFIMLFIQSVLIIFLGQEGE